MRLGEGRQSTLSGHSGPRRRTADPDPLRTFQPFMLGSPGDITMAGDLSADFATNRMMWDGKVAAHLNSPLYDVPGFLSGKLSLREHVIRDLGNVEGKALLHLQCHIGLDTLSWARRGAQVTGLDFSSSSVEAARSLARQTGLEATFITANVYEAVLAVGRTFDIVYTGVGALCWLPDLPRWAEVVAALLKPGGLLYLFEFHPVEWMLDQDEVGELRLRFDYFTPEAGFRDGGAVNYAAGDESDQAVPAVQWNHSLGDVISSLISAGLTISTLREIDRTVLEKWSGMERADDGMFRMKQGPNMPLMYVVEATRRP